MFAPTKTPALRRMKLEELITKLEQIEQQAALTLDEYPGGLTIERQRLILAIAKQLKAHLKEQARLGPRVAVVEQPVERHLHSVEIGKAKGQ